MVVESPSYHRAPPKPFILLLLPSSSSRAFEVLFLSLFYLLSFFCSYLQIDKVQIGIILVDLLPFSSAMFRLPRQRSPLCRRILSFHFELTHASS
ncbi:hypothetical protein SDJN02_19857 [Cucurbita argyrosperma subsp. argyrosperma]|nr:hypothetical protein SDJN02_19857 [Cucurbita argyrosperma subsp. argyrosperma]